MPDRPILPPIPGAFAQKEMVVVSANQGPLAGLDGAPPPAPAWFTETVAIAPESSFVEVEGVPIHYLRWGRRGRPGVLLVHGNAAHAYWWSFIGPFLARDFNVAAMDLSGMGESGWRTAPDGTGDYAMDQFAREQIAVCEAAGLFACPEAPVIVGHSFGGFVTMLTGSLYGERLAGTVIVDSPVNPPVRPGAPHTPQPPRPHNIYPSLAAAMARFRLMPPQPCENLFILDWIARHSLKEVAGGFTWKFDPAIWTRFSIGDMAERLKATKCRIAIFRGEHSVLMPPETGAYMFNLLGRAAPMVEIPQAQHHIMLDQPLAFVAALRALLADWEHSTAHRRG
jgi:pimeloyl-ACP methyl ester carboxylesterase